MKSLQTKRHPFVFLIGLVTPGILLLAVALTRLPLNTTIVVAILGGILLSIAGFLVVHEILFGAASEGVIEQVSSRMDEIASTTSANTVIALEKHLNISRSASSLGLKACANDSSNFDYSKIISDAVNLTVVLNDGRTWLSVHRDKLRKRFQDPRLETVIYLIHPDSEMIAVLARKGSIDPENLRGRIHESVSLISDIVQPDTSIEVLGHFLYNPHSMLISETIAVQIPYFTSRGGRTVPVYIYEDTGSDCYYRDLAADVVGLRMDSARLMTNERNPSVAMDVAALRLLGHS